MALAQPEPVSNEADRRHALWVLLARDAEIPELPTARPSWHALAACSGKSDVMFSTTRAGIAEAKAICRTCPAIEACARDAIERDERYGVWGALDPADRLTFKRS